MLTETAKNLGIKDSKLQEAMADEKLGNVTKQNKEMASSIGIQGTPAFIVGDELIPGAISLEELRKKIQDLRAANKKG